MRAAEAGHLECVKQLAEADSAHLNAQDKDGNTALMAAAGNGHNAVVHMLLEHHADVGLRNKDDHTALTKAMSGYGDAATVMLLVSRAVPINATVKVLCLGYFCQLT
jgi:hypothetical protein